jgi:hypothetical protein
MMPIRPPSLDDRGFADLVDEVLARIPAHTPEWTNPRVGDPGRTLIELFAWLTDTLLYRANLIPERQRLAFLRLLGTPMRPAIAARGLVTVSIDDDKVTDAVLLRSHATIKSPAPFETRAEMTVLPVSAVVYAKRRLSGDEQREFADLLPDLREVYGIAAGATAVPYVTTPGFPDGVASTAGFDIVRDAVDKCLWVALFAGKADAVEAVRQALGGTGGRQRILNVGVMPRIEVPAMAEEIGVRARVPHVWEITGPEAAGAFEYFSLDVVEDTTDGLTQRGVLRLVLPPAGAIGAPSNDVRRVIDAGVGDRPPRLDDPDRAGRLVTWIRLRPTEFLESLALSWVGVNAAEIDQRQTTEQRVVGVSDGTADQEVTLGATSIEPDSLEIQIEETGRGYVLWARVDDLATAGRDAAVYLLDSEAGTIRFGDGVRGRIPEAGRRMRVLRMRAGGGQAGNLPPQSLVDITARDLDGRLVTKLKVLQPLPTIGGEDAEDLAQAERRIPAILRHRDRAVTEEDYRRLAASTPGVRVGRVEVLPRFKPHQRRSDVPGVVSVVALPFKEERQPPNPRPDRPFLETVHAYLDARRPLTTELYTIGCEYVPLGVSVGITLREGFGRDAIVNAVRDELRRHLWPLETGGATPGGWPLGKAVRDRELEVIVARVEGVNAVAPVNLFVRQGREWRLLPRADANALVTLTLERYQLPELLSVVVVTDAEAPSDLRGVPNPFGETANQVAVPVVPELC